MKLGGSKLIVGLIMVGVAAVGLTIWRLAGDDRILLPQVLSKSSPSPTPISAPKNASTSVLMQLLKSAADDGGESDIQQLQQEAAGL